MIGTVDVEGVRNYGRGVRLFVADAAGDQWRELTSGGTPAVRLAAPDLLRAQRGAARLRSEHRGAAVVLDLAVEVPGDYRDGGAGDGTLRYAGTVAGLTGLIADIELAGVADGVTLIPAADGTADEARALGYDVLRRLADRQRKSA